MELVRRPAAEKMEHPAAGVDGTAAAPQGGARLLVESVAAEPVKTAAAASSQSEASPKKAIPGTAIGAEPVKPTATGGGGLGSLTRIRQQFSNRTSTDDAATVRPLEQEALQQAWLQYVGQLRENRNPAAQSLELATLRIIDNNSFEVITGNNLEQKFVEQEKRNLSDHLQKLFSNRTLSFVVVVAEKGTVEEEPADRPLNKREQFLQIVEQYPLVKELKDRLKLELDY
jgi:DNA polymerase-3 subunit gamma/tau